MNSGRGGGVGPTTRVPITASVGMRRESGDTLPRPGVDDINEDKLRSVRLPE